VTKKKKRFREKLAYLDERKNEIACSPLEKMQERLVVLKRTQRSTGKYRPKKGQGNRRKKIEGLLN